MTRKLGRSLESCADMIVDLVKSEFRVTLKEAGDRAHIATTGDRPFTGCNPHSADAADDPAIPAGAAQTKPRD